MQASLQLFSRGVIYISDWLDNEAWVHWSSHHAIKSPFLATIVPGPRYKYGWYWFLVQVQLYQGQVTGYWSKQHAIGVRYTVHCALHYYTTTTCNCNIILVILHIIGILYGYTWIRNTVVCSSFSLAISFRWNLLWSCTSGKLISSRPMNNPCFMIVKLFLNCRQQNHQ